MLDVAKPLLFLFNRHRVRKKSRADIKAVKTTLKFWAGLYHSVLKSRRKNILSQIYPEYVSLLDNCRILRGGDHFFWAKFMEHLVAEANDQSTLSHIRPTGTPKLVTDRPSQASANALAISGPSSQPFLHSQGSSNGRVVEISFDGWLEAVPIRLLQDPILLENGSGSVRPLMEQAAPEIRELVPSTLVMVNERVLIQLEDETGVRVPSIQPHLDVYIEVDQRPGISGIDNPVLAQAVLVPITLGDVDWHTALIQRDTGPPDIPVGGEPSSNSGRIDSVSRLETLFRERFRVQGLPKVVADLLLGATRANTHAAYQTAWVAWRDWCNRVNFNPLSVGVTEMLTLLTKSFLASKSYSSINIQTSMISSTLSDEIGKHPLVTALLKGMYNESPPSPEYTHTWDPPVVLSYLETQELAILSTLQLARKSAVILVLTTFLRCG